MTQERIQHTQDTSLALSLLAVELDLSGLQDSIALLFLQVDTN